MYLTKVWNSTGWSFDGFEGGEADGAMTIGIGIDIGECLISAPIFTSFSSSAVWYEPEKYEMMLVIFIVTYTLRSVPRICIIFLC